MTGAEGSAAKFEEIMRRLERIERLLEDQSRLDRTSAERITKAETSLTEQERRIGSVEDRLGAGTTAGIVVTVVMGICQVVNVLLTLLGVHLGK